MERIYLLEPGSYLRLEGDSLAVFKEGKKVDQIPATGLKRLTLMGRAALTGRVLDYLIDNGVDTVFITPTGRFRARLLLDSPGHVRLRMLQYRRLGDEGFCLETARFIVMKKLENQRGLLLSRSSRALHPERVREAAIQIQAISRWVSSGAVADLDSLRGAEGQGSRVFYSVFGLLIRNEAFEFKGRNKRPPLDPVNALLSFTYTLFTNEVMSAIKQCGLDPYLGALHSAHHGTPALACDLVEEWRTCAENFVLILINKRMVSPDDFINTGNEEAPVLMTPRFLRALIKAHEMRMSGGVKATEDASQGQSLRWRIYGRVREFVSYLKGDIKEF